MKRWSIAFALALLAALIVLSGRSSSPQLLKDGDTRFLVNTIQKRHAPLSWFVGDWPLGNHFYRPLPTMVLEFDNWVSHENPVGYGWTAAFLAFSCILTLFWFLREMFDKPEVALAGTALFAFWQSPYTFPLSTWVGWGAWATLVVGAIRHRLNWRRYVPAWLVLTFFCTQLDGLQPLYGRMVVWVPGCTASVFTLFALASMAAYARYERLRGRADPLPEPTPLTPPATKSTVVRGLAVAGTTPSLTSGTWAGLGVLFGAAAFASYEQAVMLPACLLAVAVTFRLSGYRPAWGWQVAFWGLLPAYLLLRHAVIPPGESWYQAQQIRTSKGAQLALWPLILPAAGSQQFWTVAADMGLSAVFVPALYQSILQWISTLTTVWELRRDWVRAFAGWGMSILAFLPMAWLHIFEHYYYWPMALRTILVVSLASVAWKLTSIAWSPPTRQAPPRPSPAPGSLPRP